MSEGIIGILSGLIGSILTVVITKLLELIQKKNEFKYDLKKQFFAKKLLAAEKTIMQYSHLSEALNQLIVLFSRYKESNSNVGKNLNDNLFNQLDQKIALVNSSAFALSSSITLYFDLTSNYSTNEILTSFYDQVNMLAPYVENVEITHEQYLRFKGTEQENEAYEIYQNAESYLDQAMKNVAEGYKIFDVELRNQIGHIRVEMKKYE